VLWGNIHAKKKEFAVCGKSIQSKVFPNIYIPKMKDLAFLEDLKWIRQAGNVIETERLKLNHGLENRSIFL
jgi:hypothetical protein